MAVMAALLYGLGDAVSEYSVKHLDRVELLGMLGLFGAILTGIQFPFQESDTLYSLFSDPEANKRSLILIVFYVALLLLYYITEASFLVSSDATLLNLSLQAQNLWAILFSVLKYESAPPVLFYLALALVFLGVFAYEGGRTGPTTLESDIELEDCEGALVPDIVVLAGSHKMRNQGCKEYDSIPQQLQ